MPDVSGLGTGEAAPSSETPPGGSERPRTCVSSPDDTHTQPVTSVGGAVDGPHCRDPGRAGPTSAPTAPPSGAVPRDIASAFLGSAEPGAVTRRFAVLPFLALSVLWGLSFPAITVGLEFLPPLLFAAFRYDVAAVVLLAAAVAWLDEWLPTRREDFEAIVPAGLFFVAGNGLLFVGQQTVPGGVAAILQALVPIATALWLLLLLGERLSPVGAVGVAVGFLGIGLVVRPDPANLLAGDTLGRLLVVGQVGSVSLGAVLVQRAGPTIHRVPMTGWSMLLGAILLHAASAGLGEAPDAGAFVPTSVGAVVYLGVFSTAIAFFIYFTILEDEGAFQASLVAYLVPIVATLAGVFLLGESISALALVGFALLKRQAIEEATGLPVGVGRP